jgi:hypothetical protein
MSNVGSGAGHSGRGGAPSGQTGEQAGRTGAAAETILNDELDVLIDVVASELGTQEQLRSFDSQLRQNANFTAKIRRLQKIYRSRGELEKTMFCAFTLSLVLVTIRCPSHLCLTR